MPQVPQLSARHTRVAQRRLGTSINSEASKFNALKSRKVIYNFMYI